MARHKRRADWRSRIGKGLVATGVAVMGLPLLASGVGAQNNVPNPPLGGACGIDMTIALDTSGSIGTANRDVRNAAQSVIDALVGTGSQVKVIRFANTARGLGATGAGASSNDYVDDLSRMSFRDPATISLPANGFDSEGGTNWDDALETARRSQGGPGKLVMVITDGEPTYRNLGGLDDGVAQNGHGTGRDGTGNSVNQHNVGEAGDEADAMQRAGTRVFAVGVGNALDSTVARDRLAEFSGPNRMEGPDGVLGTADDLPFQNADQTTVRDFTALAQRLRGVVTELCSPGLNIRKMVIPAGGGAVAPAGGWEIGAELPGYEPPRWDAPAGASGRSASMSTTDNGYANFKWTTPGDDPLARTDLTFSERLQPGFEFESLTCGRNRFDGSPQEPVTFTGPVADGDLLTFTLTGAANNVGAQEAVNCVLTNRAITRSTINVDKVTVPALASPGFDFQLRRGDANGPVVSNLDGLTGPGQGATPFAEQVEPGTYTITETAVPQWTNSAATCTRPGLAEPVSAVNLVVGENEDWTCTFTNTAAAGRITVVKNTVGAPEGTFGFTSTVPGQASFDITTTATGTGSAGTGSVSFDAPATAPGQQYSITEAVPGGFTPGASATCDNGQQANAVTVDPGQHVTCTFLNVAPEPTITVTKTPNPTQVPETGADVTYTAVITNTSVEELVLSALTDTIEPAVDGGTAAPLPTLGDMCGADLRLPVGGEITCTFTLPVSSADDANRNAVVEDTIRAVALDSDGNEAVATAVAGVTLIDIAPTLTVTKRALPGSLPEPGGAFQFTVTVENDSPEPVRLTSLVDAPAFPAGSECAALAEANRELAASDGVTGAGADAVSCTFAVDLEGNAGLEHVDQVTATVTDDEGTTATGMANERIVLTDVAPLLEVSKTAVAVDGEATTNPQVAETGGTVTYEVTVTNRSVRTDPVTITDVVDLYDGAPLTDLGTCAALVGTVLAPGATETCTYSVQVSGQAGDVIVNRVTITGHDDEGNETDASDDEAVDVYDVAAELRLTKDVLTRAGGEVDSDHVVDEPGGDVNYRVTITNVSEEVATITSLRDAVGDVEVPMSAECTDLVGTTVAPGATVTCEFVARVEGLGGTTVIDTVRMTYRDDDEGTPEREAHDSASVRIRDLLPTAELTKVATPTEHDEPGTTVTFTVSIANTSSEALELTALTDTIGDTDTALGGKTLNIVKGSLTEGVLSSTCEAGTTIPAGGEYTCSFQLQVTGKGDTLVQDTVIATLVDDEGNEVHPQDQAEVRLRDVLPEIAVTKRSVTGSRPAPGGAFTFEVTVLNLTSEPVTIDELTDAIDGGEAFSILTDSKGDQVLDTDCEAPQGGLGANASFTCQFTVELASNEAVSIPDLVTVKGHDDEGNTTGATASALARITASADVSIKKETVGRVTTTATYRLVVSNAGPSKATAVTVVDSLPAGLTASSVTGEGWECLTTGGGRTVTCTLAELASGASSTVTVVADVDASVRGTEVTNTATITTPTPDPDPKNNTSRVTDPVPPTMVEGQQINRPPVVTQLARTGRSLFSSAAFGGVLIGVGLAALLSARRRREELTF